MDTDEEFTTMGGSWKGLSFKGFCMERGIKSTHQVQFMREPSKKGTDKARVKSLMKTGKLIQEIL